MKINNLCRRLARKISRNFSKSCRSAQISYFKFKSTAHLREFLTKKGDKYIYFGNLGKDEQQFSNRKFLGLALFPLHKKEIYHDATTPLPFLDESIRKAQSQDVFEHINHEKLPSIFNEIYRVMVKGGTFRLSLPDYNSGLLKKRSIYNHNGKIIGDIMMGAIPEYDPESEKVRIRFTNDGNAHLWFPTFENLKELISRSDLGKCSEIIFHQAMINEEEYICNEIPDPELPIIRSVPNDMRNNGKPISIVVDFIK